MKASLMSADANNLVALNMVRSSSLSGCSSTKGYKMPMTLVIV